MSDSCTEIPRLELVFSGPSHGHASASVMSTCSS